MEIVVSLESCYQMSRFPTEVHAELKVTAQQKKELLSTYQKGYSTFLLKKLLWTHFLNETLTIFHKKIHYKQDQT